MATATEPIVRDRLYIGGEWVEPAGKGTIDVLNPSTEEVLGTIPEGTAEDADRAVRAARTAPGALPRRRPSLVSPESRRSTGRSPAAARAAVVARLDESGEAAVASG